MTRTHTLNITLYYSTDIHKRVSSRLRLRSHGFMTSGASRVFASGEIEPFSQMRCHDETVPPSARSRLGGGVTGD